MRFTSYLSHFDDTMEGNTFREVYNGPRGQHLRRVLLSFVHVYQAAITTIHTSFIDLLLPSHTWSPWFYMYPVKNRFEYDYVEAL